MANKDNKHQLDRRIFILGSAAAGALAAQTQPAAPNPDGHRRSYDLNRKWLFGGKTRAGVSFPGFNDSDWRKITLPHTNAILPWHSFAESAFQYVSAYRRHFRALPEWRGKRVFLGFGGAMTASTVTVNGHKFDEYKGGYTPFSFELTPHLKFDADNVIAVELDSTERADIPPFGLDIDYLTFGGIYRDVELRVVPKTFIDNVYAKVERPLAADRAIDVRCYLQGALSGHATLTAELRDGTKVLKTVSAPVSGQPEFHEVRLESLPEIELWNLKTPKMYEVVVRLVDGGSRGEYRTRVGFREARYTPTGFMLNGERVKLFGLNRHQTFPYVGGAMPTRVQRRDAWILRRELHCNIVRTSHYPQAPAFLDACDELGLLVLEEIPGWQHIGDKAWQDIAVRNVGEMIRRDWNHPSIVLWGVRINESQDNHDFYTRTNALAHSLDDARQTGGIRYLYDSELLEDVMTMNDFGFPLRPPNHPLYLNTEFNGHMFPTKRNDNVDRVMEHALRHARVHNQLASDDRYAGGIGWCAFDYNTHANFGSGDKICYHGVTDIFRIPKPAGQFYRSQCDPKEEIVLEPCFNWSQGDQSEGGGIHHAVIVSNCDHLKIYVKGDLKAEVEPDREHYGHLPHPPFVTDLAGEHLEDWGDLRIDGYITGAKVIEKTLPGNDYDRQLHVEPDDAVLVGDGIDATRVVLRVTNEHDGARPFSTGAVALRLEGPGEIVGENPFSLVGGVGAVWVRSKEAAGVIRLHARHQYLGERTAEIRVTPAEAEQV